MDEAARRKRHEESKDWAVKLRYKLSALPMDEAREQDREQLKEAIEALGDEGRTALMCAIGLENEGVTLRSRDEKALTEWATNLTVISALWREVERIAAEEEELVQRLLANHILYDELLRRQKRHPEDLQALWRGDPLPD